MEFKFPSQPGENSMAGAWVGQPTGDGYGRQRRDVGRHGQRTRAIGHRPADGVGPTSCQGPHLRVSDR